MWTTHRITVRRDCVETARQPGRERRGRGQHTGSQHAEIPSRRADAPELGQRGGMAWGRRLWRWWRYLAERDRGAFFPERIVGGDRSFLLMTREAVWRRARGSPHMKNNC